MCLRTAVQPPRTHTTLLPRRRYQTLHLGRRHGLCPRFLDACRPAHSAPHLSPQEQVCLMSWTWFNALSIPGMHDPWHVTRRKKLFASYTALKKAVVAYCNSVPSQQRRTELESAVHPGDDATSKRKKTKNKRESVKSAKSSGKPKKRVRMLSEGTLEAREKTTSKKRNRLRPQSESAVSQITTAAGNESSNKPMLAKKRRKKRKKKGKTV